MNPNEHILFFCKQLKLDYISENYEDIVGRATKKRTPYIEFLEENLKLECDDRCKRSIQRRLKSAKLGIFKTIGEFDWLWPKKIPKETIDEIMKLNFIKEKSNVILLAPAGLGKTMLAKNIAHRAASTGISTLFVEVSDLIMDLEQQESTRRMQQRLNHYIKPSVLVIDEIGYQTYASTKAADLLFQVITKRHEKNSTIITTNLAFKDWGQVFMQAGSLVPMIDRLTQKSDIVVIEGDSYRRREASTRKKTNDNKEVKKNESNSR